jgi:putative NADH-flavin reductase
MRILIIGAAGQVGRLTVERALAAGHEVTAFARSRNEMEPRPRLTYSQGDVLVAADVDAVVQGHDAVILTFGAPLTRDTVLHQPSLCETGTRHVVAALARSGSAHLVCMTSLGAGNSAHHGRFIFRNLVAPLMLGRILRDRTAQEDVVQSSRLNNWVIVRPTELADGDPAAVRIISNLDHETEPTTITRASVAQVIVDLASDHRFDRSAITITN